MAKNLKNLKSVEFIDTAAKRALVNGMTVTYVEKFTGMKKRAVAEINGRLKVEDYKDLRGETMADCVCQESQQIIADSLKSGDTQKWVMQQSKLPKSVISAIADKYGIIDTNENEAIETNNEEITEDSSTEVDVTEDGVVTYNRKGRAPKYDDDVAELIYTESRNGKTYKEIIKEYGIARSTIINLIQRYKKSHNISTVVANHNETHNPSGKRAINNETVIAIANDIINGERNVDIANKYNVSPLTVSEIRCKRTYVSLTKDYDFTIANRNRSAFANSNLNEETFNKIISMILDRKSDKIISEELNISETVVGDIRVKRTFRKLTKGMIFPEPIPNTFDRRLPNFVNRKEDDIIDSSESINSDDGAIMSEVESDNAIDAKYSYESIDTDIERQAHMYFSKIAKTFAADRAAVIIVKDNQMLSYMVANTIEECMIRTISLLSPEEIRESNVYVSGHYNDIHDVIRMSKIVEINDLIIK